MLRAGGSQVPGRFRQRAVVLLVEDNPDDVVMIREAFEQSLTPIQLYVVSNGEQAIKFVRRTAPDALRPSLILLDLNLPIRNGLDILAELKSDTEFLSIPIVVLTTSRAPNDIQQCYSLHANAYIIKPPDFDGYADVIKQVATCFLGLISLPP
jgi:CheY-like chemotaxis protein